MHPCEGSPVSVDNPRMPRGVLLCMTATIMQQAQNWPATSWLGAILVKLLSLPAPDAGGLPAAGQGARQGGGNLRLGLQPAGTLEPAPAGRQR